MVQLLKIKGRLEFIADDQVERVIRLECERLERCRLIERHMINKVKFNKRRRNKYLYFSKK